MSAGQLYDHVYAEWDSSLLLQNSTLEIDWDAQDVLIKTIAGGYVGISPDAEHMLISLNSYLPIAGFEVDFVKIKLAHETHSLRLQTGGGASLTVVVFVFNAVKLTSGVGKASEFQVQLVGDATPFTGGLLGL